MVWTTVVSRMTDLVTTYTAKTTVTGGVPLLEGCRGCEGTVRGCRSRGSWEEEGIDSGYRGSRSLKECRVE